MLALGILALGIIALGMLALGILALGTFLRNCEIFLYFTLLSSRLDFFCPALNLEVVSIFLYLFLIG